MDQFKEYIPSGPCERPRINTSKEKIPSIIQRQVIEKKALDIQIGGSHYKDFVIQPIEFIMKNNLNFCQGNIIKYICRYKDKNGIEDLKKIKHYVDLLIQLEYPNEQNQGILSQ